MAGSLPQIWRKLFENNGQGPNIKSGIIPIDNDTIILNNDNKLAASGIPSGVITMWSGAIADIPTGWALCNGENGTPNLLDRFIIAAGNNSAPGDTGGAATHTHDITVDATALSISQMPNHGHSFGPHGQVVAAGNERQGVPEGSGYLNTGKQGGGLGHVHSASSGSASNIPPYYALAYIMKL